jgi:hypothetical protein
MAQVVTNLYRDSMSFRKAEFDEVHPHTSAGTLAFTRQCRVKLSACRVKAAFPAFQLGAVGAVRMHPTAS